MAFCHGTVTITNTITNHLQLSLDSIVPIGSTLSNEELNQLVLLHEDSTASDKAAAAEYFRRKVQIHPPRDTPNPAECTCVVAFNRCAYFVGSKGEDE
ncbi:hypothetical protein KIN20_010591 [Parelaphostrongylus tenuis]|uniref:Uncharacterized protein n=1 Tax=Parelaphostrongylus tenuis TaxID=148309 RepID=A0AAD5QP84_PARTN|nr:hypothetical protein KIN20_010591 [Parelaphostrongylus tenuis]